MLQNARVTAFTVSELLRENQQGGGGELSPPPTQVRAYGYASSCHHKETIQSTES